MAGETFTQEQVEAMIAERLASEVDGLKKSQAQLLREKKEAQARAALFEGMDPEEVKSLKAKFTELEQTAKAQAAGITSEALAKLRQEAAAEYEKKYGPVLSERDALKAENRSLKLDTKVKDLMAKSGARPERIEALFRLSSDRFDLTDDGNPMVKGATKEVDKYIVEDLLKEYPEFFMGSGSSGGGAFKSSGGAGGGVRVIAAGDERAFIANVEDIAHGKVAVR